MKILEPMILVHHDNTLYTVFIFAFSRSCGKCFAECNFCKGEEEMDCLHCKIDQFFENGTCVSQCRAGSYPQKLSGGEQMCVR